MKIQEMFYSDAQGNRYGVVSFKSYEDMKNSTIERVHIWNSQNNHSLCGIRSAVQIVFGAFTGRDTPFPPCLECVEIAHQLKITPIQQGPEPIHESYPHLDFFDEPYQPNKATRYSWNIREMPQKKARLEIHSVITEAELQTIKMGFVPQEMENRWFIYFENDWLHIHRSWTGFCIYQVRFEQQKNHYKVIEAWVNRDSSQHENDDDSDTKLLTAMIKRLPDRINNLEKKSR